MGSGDNSRAGLALSFPAHVHVGLVRALPAIPFLTSSIEV